MEGNMVTKADRENRAQFAAMIALLDPSLSITKIVDVTNKLGSVGARINRHCEKMCSYEWYYSQHCDETGEDTTLPKLEARAAKLAAEIGCTVDCNGDPRGYCLYIKRDGLRGNTWGGGEHGWGLN